MIFIYLTFPKPRNHFNFIGKSMTKFNMNWINSRKELLHTTMENEATNVLNQIDYCPRESTPAHGGILT